MYKPDTTSRGSDHEKRSASPVERRSAAKSDTSAGTLIIACGAIAHELVSVTQASQFGAIEIQCLPPEWHNHPQRIAPAVQQRIEKAVGRYRRIFVAYGDCGTGGELDRVLERHDVARLPGDHCYSFFSGRSTFDALAEQEIGTFYLTDYLVDNFERLVMEGLGLRRHPELREQYFAHYTRVLYLSQDDTRRNRRAQAARAADALALPLAIHPTGLQPFAQTLRQVIPIMTAADSVAVRPVTTPHA